MAQQTAVEWLDEQLQDKMYVQYGYGTGIRKIVIPIEEYIYFKQQAKAMEKEQHSNTWIDSRVEYGGDNYIGKEKTFEEYYNEIFNK